jgi:hypothetical protein
VDGSETFAVGEIYPIEISYRGDIITGRLVVRDTRALEGGILRLGGEVDWDQTSWLNEVLPIALVATPKFAASHLSIRR